LPASPQRRFFPTLGLNPTGKDTNSLHFKKAERSEAENAQEKF
jgi:hypothetical protein